MEEYIEVSAKTKEEAIMNAAIQLGTSSDNIEYDVIQEATSGLFGIGRKPAIGIRRMVFDLCLLQSAVFVKFSYIRLDRIGCKRLNIRKAFNHHGIFCDQLPDR